MNEDGAVLVMQQVKGVFWYGAVTEEDLRGRETAEESRSFSDSSAAWKQ